MMLYVWLSLRLDSRESRAFCISFEPFHCLSTDFIVFKGQICPVHSEILYGKEALKYSKSKKNKTYEPLSYNFSLYENPI